MTGRYADRELITREQAGSAATRLRELRAARGWSQVRLAREAGVPQSVVSHAETVYARMTVASAEKLAAALGTDLAGLLAGDAG